MAAALAAAMPETARMVQCEEIMPIVRGLLWRRKWRGFVIVELTRDISEGMADWMRRVGVGHEVVSDASSSRSNMWHQDTIGTMDTVGIFLGEGMSLLTSGSV